MLSKLLQFQKSVRSSSPSPQAWQSTYSLIIFTRRLTADHWVTQNGGKTSFGLFIPLFHRNCILISYLSLSLLGDISFYTSGISPFCFCHGHFWVVCSSSLARQEKGRKEIEFGAVYGTLILPWDAPEKGFRAEVVSTFLLCCFISGFIAR